MKVIYFFLVLFFSFLFFSRISKNLNDNEVLYDIAAYSMGSFLFLYAISKVYFYYLSFFKSIFLSVFERLLPLILLFGISKKIVGDFNLDLIGAAYGSILLLLLFDPFLKIRKEVMKTPFGRGWEDQLEQSIFFVQYPPKRLSDMIVPHIMMILMILILYI